MYVIATAGHVDHGKSTLVKALTDMEPDRWEEEKRRGLTIDLGFAWTTLPSGNNLAFVDVPGHERFLSNTLAGLGPAPKVMLVVAADEGWQAQTSDHRDAIAALGLSGLVALTRIDRASEENVAETKARVRHELAGTSLEKAAIVPVSAKTGEGLDSLRTALDGVVEPGLSDSRVRLWVDRAFSVKGAGTVVTGTLSAGTISVGEQLELLGHGAVEVRGLQSENQPQQHLGPVSRVAVNLRGVEVSQLSRGAQLLTRGAWLPVSVVDVRGVTGAKLTEIPQEIVAHIGSAQVQVRLRPLSEKFARLTFAEELALELTDRVVLRSPGHSHVLAGVEVMDLDPPELKRRGDSARRAAELERSRLDGAEYIKRHGAVEVEKLKLLGFGAQKPAGVIDYLQWWVNATTLMEWKKLLLSAVAEHRQRNPLSAGLPKAAAVKAIDLPDPSLLALVVAMAKLETVDGVIRAPGATLDLGAAESAVARLEEQLRKDPFLAPEAGQLKELGLSHKELAAAQRAGRILRLQGNVVLLPTAVGKAKERLAGLEQPFSTSQARQALHTTRRVVIPLLEHLDSCGVTKRISATERAVILR